MLEDQRQYVLCARRQTLDVGAWKTVPIVDQSIVGSCDGRIVTGSSRDATPRECTRLLSSLTKLKRLKFFSSAWRKLFTMSDTLVIPVASLICHVAAGDTKQTEQRYHRVFGRCETRSVSAILHDGLIIGSASMCYVSTVFGFFVSVWPCTTFNEALFLC